MPDFPCPFARGEAKPQNPIGNWLRLLMRSMILAPLALVWIASLAQEDTDRITGLVRDGDWQLVQANCTECHSVLLITQNSGNRSVWQSRLAWMVDSQGMEPLAVELEARILDYLEQNYGPRQSARRPPLPGYLLPENPYPAL